MVLVGVAGVLVEGISVDGLKLKEGIIFLCL